MARVSIAEQTRWLSLLEQGALVRSGQVSALELVEATAERRDAAAGLNAVALDELDRARAQAAQPLPDSPVAGVPFVLKDLTSAQAGLPETGGSRLT